MTQAHAIHAHTSLLRPVKVIRLISQHTVEEIVLKRAHAKLELTNTIIEGGQVCMCVYLYVCLICKCVCVCVGGGGGGGGGYVLELAYYRRMCVCVCVVQRRGTCISVCLCTCVSAHTSLLPSSHMAQWPLGPTAPHNWQTS